MPKFANTEHAQARGIITTHFLSLLDMYVRFRQQQFINSVYMVLKMHCRLT